MRAVVSEERRLREQEPERARDDRLPPRVAELQQRDRRGSERTHQEQQPEDVPAVPSIEQSGGLNAPPQLGELGAVSQLRFARSRPPG